MNEWDRIMSPLLVLVEYAVYIYFTRFGHSPKVSGDGTQHERETYTIPSAFIAVRGEFWTLAGRQ